MQQYPEARALLNAIYKYLGSDDFAPLQALSLDEAGELFGGLSLGADIENKEIVSKDGKGEVG